MHAEPLLRRYALALALVPDPDAAGDLFMDAADDADLRRRAQAWRHQRGYPEAAEEPLLPVLTAAEAAHALHLAQRARRRRQSRTYMLVGVVAACVVGVLSALPRTEAGLPAWARDSAYVTTPPPWSATAGDVTLTVHRAEATPGVVTIWWSATGARVLKDYKTLLPKLEYADDNPIPAPDSQWIVPESQSLASSGRAVLGLSVFRLPTLPMPPFRLRLDRPGDGPLSAVVRVVPDRAAADPAARTYPVPGLVPGVPAPVTLQVGSGYAAVISSPWNLLPPGTHRYSLQVGDRQLTFLTGEQTGDDQLIEYFEGLPEGTAAVQVGRGEIYFSPTPVSVELPGQFGGVRVEQRGLDPVIRISAPNGHAVAPTGTAFDADGGQYRLELMRQSTQADGGSQWDLQVVGIWPGTRVVRAALTRLDPMKSPTVSVSLH